MASAFYLDSSVDRRTALMSYYRSLESAPPADPVAPANVDITIYSMLLSHTEQLRPTSFLRPPPTGWSDFQLAVAARSVVKKKEEDTVDSSRKDNPDPMEISSALHSTLDDIQQILSAGPSSSHDHTHLDEQALGEITAFLQSGPPVAWPENDAVRLTNVGNILPITNVSVLQHNVAVMSDAALPASNVDQNLVKPAEKLMVNWQNESANASAAGCTSAIVCLKRYQCVLCLVAFDVPPSTQQHNGSCGVCAGDVLEVPVYRCRRCGVSYYSESAAQHHALFLCTRDDAGDDIGCILRQYSCPLCHVAFFSSAGLQSHSASVHSSLEMSVSSSSKLGSLTNTGNFCQSEIFPQQSGMVQTPTQIHSPFVLSSAASSSPASAEEASLPCKVSQSPESAAVGVGMSQSKPRVRRRYSGRPPKGIIYKNVFMTSEGLYYCSTCSADLNTVERRTEHRGRPCGRVSAASYARHYVFICPHCSSRWPSQKACYEHQITTCLPQLGISVSDLTLRRFACPICSRLHYSLAPLRGHMTTAHRMHRNEVIQRLIAAGYMTPEGTNVQFDNVVGIQQTSIAKPSRNICNSPSTSSTITEAEVIALLNKELKAALNEREHFVYNQSSGDRKLMSESTESATKSDCVPSKLSVLTAFPQLPKPVLNLRAIPKIMATSLSSAVTSSSAVKTCSISSNASIPVTTTADSKFDMNNTVCNDEQKLAVSESITSSSGDMRYVSSSVASSCTTVNDVLTSVKTDVASADSASGQELECETSLKCEKNETGAVVSPICEVTLTAVSPKCHTTSTTAREMEKPSIGNNGGIPVRNGKLKFIFSKSDTGEQQIQLPVVALERTNLSEITSRVTLSAASRGSKLRPRQHSSVNFSAQSAVHTRHRFNCRRTTSLRKSARVSHSWKSAVPVLRIPVNHPRTRASHGFSYKHSLSCSKRLVDQKLQKKKSFGGKDFTFDCFRSQRAVAQAQQSHQHFAAVSSGADNAAVSTRSQCRRLIKHSVVR